MSTTGRDQSSAPAASDVADALREAGFVRLVARADGDSLAATGVLARALDARGTPFQATVVRPFSDATRATDADLTVAVGHADATADVSVAGPNPSSVTAFEAAGELGDAPDPTLALAGTIAAGELSGTVAEAAEDAGIERRLGVAVPVPDLADGLAHSTLVHAPFSGDADAAADAFAELDLPADGEVPEALDEDDHRRVASLVALAVTGSNTLLPARVNASNARFDPSLAVPSRRSGATPTCSTPPPGSDRASALRWRSATTASTRKPSPRGAATPTGTRPPSPRRRRVGTTASSSPAGPRCPSAPSRDSSPTSARRNR